MKSAKVGIASLDSDLVGSHSSVYREVSYSELS